jgi:SAM-dependent methyltransferase
MREDADVETSSDDYARRFAGPVGAFLLEVQARLTLDLLKAWPGARVLDVGGGHGQLTGPVEAATTSCLRKLPACARIASAPDGRRPRPLRGRRPLRTPFPDGGFDVVVSYRLLPHVSAWRQLLGELCRVAKRAVLVDFPSLRSVNVVSGAGFGFKKRVEENTRPVAVFREADVERALAAAGFKPTGRRPQFLFPMALHRALGWAGFSRALEGGGSALGLTRLLGSPVILRAEHA